MTAIAPPSCQIAAAAAYAAWPDGKPPTVSIALTAERRLSFGERLPLGAVVSTAGGDVTISRFLAATRGIAFDVRDAEGRQVCPAESPPWSPPPPPPSDEADVLVTPSAPYRVKLDEPGKWVFPGPGIYSIRAVLFLWGPGGGRTGPDYTAMSAPLIVDVKP